MPVSESELHSNPHTQLIFWTVVEVISAAVFLFFNHKPTILFIEMFFDKQF